MRHAANKITWRTMQHIPTNYHVIAELDDFTIVSGRFMTGAPSGDLVFRPDVYGNIDKYIDPSYIIHWDFYPDQKNSLGDKTHE